MSDHRYRYGEIFNYLAANADKGETPAAGKKKKIHRPYIKAMKGIDCTDLDPSAMPMQFSQKTLEDMGKEGALVAACDADGLTGEVEATIAIFRHPSVHGAIVIKMRDGAFEDKSATELSFNAPRELAAALGEMLTKWAKNPTPIQSPDDDEDEADEEDDDNNDEDEDDNGEEELD